MTKARYVRNVALAQDENDLVEKLQRQGVSIISIFLEGLRIYGYNYEKELTTKIFGSKT